MGAATSCDVVRSTHSPRITSLVDRLGPDVALHIAAFVDVRDQPTKWLVWLALREWVHAPIELRPDSRPLQPLPPVRRTLQRLVMRADPSPAVWSSLVRQVALVRELVVHYDTATPASDVLWLAVRARPPPSVALHLPLAADDQLPEHSAAWDVLRQAEQISLTLSHSHGCAGAHAQSAQRVLRGLSGGAAIHLRLSWPVCAHRLLQHVPQHVPVVVVQHDWCPQWLRRIEDDVWRPLRSVPWLTVAGVEREDHLPLSLGGHRRFTVEVRRTSVSRVALALLWGGGPVVLRFRSMTASATDLQLVELEAARSIASGQRIELEENRARGWDNARAGLVERAAALAPAFASVRVVLANGWGLGAALRTRIEQTSNLTVVAETVRPPIASPVVMQAWLPWPGPTNR